MTPNAKLAIPDRACSTGHSPVFHVSSMPEALGERHTLARGNWARLDVLSGSLTYCDLASGETAALAAGEQRTIAPGEPHRVLPQGAATFRIEFFREAR